MKTNILLGGLFLGALLLSASCSNGSDHSSSGTGDSLVLGLVQDTSDTSDPVDINTQTLTFSEDPHQFDSLFQ